MSTIASTGPASRPAAPSPLRLTRRGRLVFIALPLFLLAAALLTSVGFLNAPAVAADVDGGLQPTEAVVYTVTPGDTLWGVAAAVAPKQDAREVVAGMVELNGLDSATIHAGQQLFVPAGD